MAIRTNSARVRDILVGHYDGSTSLTPFITAASNLVDYCDSQDTDGVMSDTSWELVERWLSAHTYATGPDMIAQSEGASKANASYQGQTGMYFSSTHYGQTAMLLDVTGCLAKLEQQAKSGKRKAGVVWLGTRYKDDESERTSDQ
jgi:hypothetical protein